MDIYIETLPKATKKVLNKINNIPDLKNFYLSGGTALSLQLGHRESEDLDFFNQKQFLPEVLQQKLLSIGSLNNVEMAEGTLNTFLENVKLQFLYYPYDLLEKLQPWNGIFLSSVIDIACTKLITISMRGSKKDFVDLYFILKQFPLPELFRKLDEKYLNINYSHTHILKSLIYFEDADNQPMPRMHLAADWEEVKNTILEAVKKIQF
jgi:hypothetical protein